MNQKVEAIRDALHAFCVEQGVRLSLNGGHDYCALRIDEAYEDFSGGFAVDDYELEFNPAPTPEEIERQKARQREWEERMAAQEARWQEERAARLAEEQASLAALTESAHYLNLMRAVEANATETKERRMRISTDPNDPAYIDARPRKVWVGERLIEGWTVADEFRRVVITPEKVHHGAVLIERLPDAPAEVTVAADAVAEKADDRPIEQLPRVQQETRPAKRRR